MIQVLPRDSVVAKVLVSDVLLLAISLCKSLCLFVLDVLVEGFDSSRGEHTFLIEGEDSWCLHLTVYSSVSDDFLHHLFLGGVTITFTNEISARYLRVRLTFLIIRAFVALGLTHIRCTVLGDKVSVLSEESVEEWPSTIATLIHIVTRHQVLGRQFWHFFTILNLKSIFSDLGERDSVAGATVTLISMLIHKIIATNVSPIKVIW